MSKVIISGASGLYFGNSLGVTKVVAEKGAVVAVFSSNEEFVSALVRDGNVISRQMVVNVGGVPTASLEWTQESVEVTDATIGDKVVEFMRKDSDRKKWIADNIHGEVMAVAHRVNKPFPWPSFKSLRETIFGKKQEGGAK